MGNLKGNSKISQIKNALIRTNQIGVSKRDANLENQAHSIATLENRERILKSFVKYMETNNITDTKINQAMTDNNLTGYINSKIENMSYSSSKTFISSVSGLVNSLIQTKVNINVSSDLFSNLKDQAKEDKYIFQSSKDIHKSFENVDAVNSHLYSKSETYGVMGEVLLHTGFRYSEAQRLIDSPGQYIRDGHIINMAGKSGRIYEPKPISRELIEKIYRLENTKINHKSFNNAIKEVEENKSAHSYRYEFAKNHQNDPLINIKMNHWRDFSKYYISRL